MKTLKVKSRTPDMVRKIVTRALGQTLESRQFNDMCFQSVNLQARNNSNTADKDLALLQVCHLAEKYGVKVELV